MNSLLIIEYQLNFAVFLNLVQRLSAEFLIEFPRALKPSPSLIISCLQGKINFRRNTARMPMDKKTSQTIELLNNGNARIARIC